MRRRDSCQVANASSTCSAADSNPREHFRVLQRRAVHPPMHHGYIHRPHAIRAIQIRTRGLSSGLSSAQSSAARFTCSVPVCLASCVTRRDITGIGLGSLVQTCDTAHLGQQCGRTPCPYSTSHSESARWVWPNGTRESIRGTARSIQFSARATCRPEHQVDEIDKRSGSARWRWNPVTSSSMRAGNSCSGSY